MIASQARGFAATAGVLAAASAVGIAAVISPPIAIGIVGAGVFIYVVFTDLASSFAMLVFLSFVATLPTSGSLSAAKGAGLLIAIGWLARLTWEWRGRRDFLAEHASLFWLLAGFLAWASITLFWTAQTGTSLTAISRYTLNFLLIPICYSAVRSRRDVRVVLAAVVIGAALAAAFAVLQPAGTEIAQESSRATGTIGDPNELASVLLVGAAVSAGVALGWQGRHPIVRLVALVTVPLCVAAVFLSLSRGGLVAFSVMLVAGTVIAGRWRAAFVTVLLVLVAGGALYFTQFASVPARERITRVGNGTGRLDLWTVGWRMVQAHPFTGVGIGNFQDVSGRYVLQPGELQRTDLIFSQAPKVTHNTYLEITSEAGIPGIALFLLIIGYCLSCALRSASIWARRGDRRMEALARGVFLGLVGMLTADFFISDQYNKLLWALFALGPAMLSLARSEVALRDGDLATRRVDV